MLTLDRIQRQSDRLKPCIPAFGNFPIVKPFLQFVAELFVCFLHLDE